MNLLLTGIGLGALQGVTEFLPVSSTAHLALAEKALGLDPRRYGLTFDMAINAGTVVAALAYFRADLLALLRGFRLPTAARPLNEQERTPWRIVFVTAAVGALGLALEKKIEGVFRSPWVIAAALTSVSLLMFAAERRRHDETGLTARRAYAVGLSQALALVPGVSRSGITIVTGLFTGMKREEAARWSFLLSIPITTLAVAHRLLTAKWSALGITPNDAAAYAAGAVTAAVVGYASIKFLISYVARASLAVFAWYRIALAAVLVGALLLGKL